MFAANCYLDQPYAELHCLSNFSFLRGASHPEELVEQAATLGYTALAITDRNSLAGVVRAHGAARRHNLRLIIGAEITPIDACPVVLLAPDRKAYGSLSRLITTGRLRARKGACAIRLADIAELSAGLLAVALPAASRDHDPRAAGPPRLASGSARSQPASAPAAAARSLPDYRDIFGNDLYLAAELTRNRPDAPRLGRLAALSRRFGVPLVAANDVHYHVPERRYLQDVLTCIREKCSVATAGTRLFANAERHLRPRGELARRYAAHPELIQRTVDIAARCTFSLEELRYEYPHEVVGADTTPHERLSQLTWAGARERYPDGIPTAVARQIENELALIAELKYEHYFLTVWDVVRFARARGILCQGRGSAANSAVCYALGVTAVDPARVNLLFERFISRERNEPPDIDVDFEHERREEVFQYIYNKYGRERAALTAEVITYRPRSAVRDVGKALGLSLDRVDVLAKALDWWSVEAVPDEALRNAGLDPRDRTVQMVVRLVRQILRFPRHLSQHVGGFVITETPLCEIVPLENGAMPARTFIEWDKDDIDALGILKVDCLALGMLTAIGKAFGLLQQHCGEGSGIWDQGSGRGHDGPREYDVGIAAGGEEEKRDGQHVVSRFAGVAEIDRSGKAHLRDYSAHARQRAIRSDEPDATSGNLRSQQYRRGKRAPDTEGLRPLPDAGARFAGRVGNTVDHCSGTPTDSRGTPDCTANRGSHPHAPGPNKQPATPQSLIPVPRSPIPRSLAAIPPEDPLVYDMIRAADTVGVFQIESRAQMSMLPRLKPRCFYDLVIEVAIVRPGPIQGGMIHPYLRRRDGLEPVWYPSPAVREVLEKTLGVPLFQEQVMRLAVVAAGFTPGEADQLRRSMAAWRRSGEMEKFQVRLVKGMLANGYSKGFAEQIYMQIRGFGEYGFPESHAASFALLVYVSAWLKRYHPAAFTAALLNSQPMGFYAPAQLVRDAIRHGVTVLGVDVNASGWDCSLERGIGGRGSGIGDRGSGKRERASDEPARGVVADSRLLACAPCPASPDPRSPIPGPRASPDLRLGFRLVRGLSGEKVRGIEAASRAGPIRSIEALARRPGVSRDTLVRLAAADAFRSLGLDRRQALWRILALDDADLPLLAELEPNEPPAVLPEMEPEETVVQDYSALGLSLNAHPIGLVREELRKLRVSTSAELKDTRRGRRISVAGLVTHRQRPGTAKGLVFMTLEDEVGHANLVIKPNIWDRYRAIARSKTALIAEGVVERQGLIVNLQISRLHDLSALISPIRAKSRDFC